MSGGALEHRDHSGKTFLAAGEVQRLAAGLGATHDEFNPWWCERARHLDLWLEPDRADLPPSREKRSLPRDGGGPGALHVIGAPEDGDGTLRMHQNVEIRFGRLGAGERATRARTRGRYAWLQILVGAFDVSGHIRKAGDGATISSGDQLSLVAVTPAEVLHIELPRPDPGDMRR